MAACLSLTVEVHSGQHYINWAVAGFFAHLDNLVVKLESSLVTGHEQLVLVLKVVVYRALGGAKGGGDVID